MLLEIQKGNVKTFGSKRKKPCSERPVKVAHSRIERDDLRERICIAYRVSAAQAELQIEAAIRRQHQFKPANVKL